MIGPYIKVSSESQMPCVLATTKCSYKSHVALEMLHVIIKPFPASIVVTTPKDAIAESIISNTTRPVSRSNCKGQG